MEESIADLLGEHADDWAGWLTERFGFGADQAQRFVPAILKRITQALTAGELELDGGLDAGVLLQEFDVGALASTAGVDELRARSGLEGLLPAITDTLRERTGA